ncbi:MAG TPA: DUF6220 domain-containing protein [Candidatus Dormibacteraeota bacterium]
MKKAYSVAGVVLLVEIALQFYLIAAAALNVWGADGNKDTAGSVFAGFKTGDNFASLHALNGDLVIPVTILVMIGLAFGAGHAARIKGQTAALFGLMVLQFLLASLAFTGSAALAALGGLHGLNAIAITGLAGSLVFRTWAFRPAQATEMAAAPSTSTSALDAER